MEMMMIMMEIITTFDLLNKFKNNIDADMHKFDKKSISEENK